MDKISIVLTHYDTEEYLAQSIESILGQTYHNLELYLIDDKTPSDDWKNVVEKFRSDSRLKVYQSSQNVGTYRLKNAIFPLINSPYIAFQDSDDFSSPDRLQHQHALMQKNNIDILGSGFNDLTGSGMISSRTMPQYPKPYFYCGKKFLSLHGTWMIRRSILETLQGFDGETRFGGDDDFLYRALFAFKVRNTKKILYTRRLHERSLTGSQETGLGSKVRVEYNQSVASRIKKIRSLGRVERITALKGNPNNISFSLSRLI